MKINLNKFNLPISSLILLFFFGTALIFCCNFFSDKEFSFSTIVKHSYDGKMYWHIFRALISTIFIFYFVTYWMNPKQNTESKLK